MDSESGDAVRPPRTRLRLGARALGVEWVAVRMAAWDVGTADPPEYGVGPGSLGVGRAVPALGLVSGSLALNSGHGPGQNAGPES